jgi:hypothetical protein
MLSAGLLAGFLANAGFATAEQARAAAIVAVPEGGPRVVAPGSEVVIDIFLELEPTEQVSGVRMEMDVSNLRDVSYRQVPDLMLGALPNAPWQDVSFISDRRGSVPGEGRMTAQHRSLWNPVDAAIIAKLRPAGLVGESNQVPLGGFEGVAAGPGEVTIHFYEPGNRTRCDSSGGTACQIQIPRSGFLATGIIVGDDLMAPSGLPQVAQAPTRRASDVAAGPAARAGNGTRSPRVEPTTGPSQIQMAQLAAVPEDDRCRVESKQAKLDLAEAQRDLARTRLEAANMKVELEKAQLALEQARVESKRTRAEIDGASRRGDQLELALAAAQTELADDDGDGVWNDADRCSDTPKAEGVDASGCSVVQFCTRYNVRDDEGRAACWNADFGNDEPLGNPADCKAKSRACVPR